ncbi:MAG: hypothetical protein ABI893_08915 [Polaromonas sp.]|uniref:hypothetical protein n=1 Tax=Polaromonas sp. TaxID=1869339 RepID=UPI0032659020
MQTIPKISHRRVVALPRGLARRPEPSERREYVLAGVALLLLLLAWLAPPLAQPLHYHDFADQRAWGPLPHAMDVLSNLPFVLWAAAGGWALLRAARVRAVNGAAVALAGLFFGGLMLTAVVSTAYHLHPADAGLAWDRAGMVFAFAGLLGLGALQSVSNRAGLALAAAVLVLGPLSVAVWSSSGNVLPWAVLQFGGMALIVAFACFPVARAARQLPIRWMLVIGIYALAKLLELGDHAIFEWSGHWVSGHSLKHVVAACAAWPVVSALLAARKFSAESGAASRTGWAAGRASRPSGQTRRTTTEKRSQA